MPEHASRLAAAFYDQQGEARTVADWGGDDLFTRMPRPRAVDSAPPPRFQREAADLTLVDTPADRRQAAPSEAWAGGDDHRRPARSGEEAMHARAERLGLTVVRGETSSAEDVGALDAPAPAPRGRARRADLDADGGDWAGFAPARPARARAAAAERAVAPVPLPVPPPASDAAPADPPGPRIPDGWARVEPAPAGRRTAVITGHPERAAHPDLTPARRRRPPRTPAEWIGPRPERIVAWAFVLGLLLILIAISTADAATF